MPERGGDELSRWIVAGALALAGCVATEAPLPPRGVVVSGPPPAPLVEPARPPPPGPTAVWIVGYWHWTGIQYAWIPGHWENAPPGAAWAAPAYVSEGGAYYYQAGAWHAATPTPAPPGKVNALH
jgi:hypothetical protein